MATTQTQTQTQTQTKALTFNKIKGAPNNLRIEGLDLSMLNKAAAMNNGVLVAKDEDNHPEFAICLTTGDSIITSCSLEINPEQVENGLVVCSVVNANPEATIVRAVAFIKQIYAEAEAVAKAYDKANADIKEV